MIISVNINKINQQSAEEFYNEFCNIPKGILTSYPVDESAIRAFGIRKEELKKYKDDIRDEILILRDILIDKGILNSVVVN